jgi:L-amino acid N-acyltransferase YncA
MTRIAPRPWAEQDQQAVAATAPFAAGGGARPWRGRGAAPRGPVPPGLKLRWGAMAEVSVRPAGGEDVPEIARIQLDTWRQAYSRWLPAPVLDQITPADAERTWRQAVAEPPTPRHHVLVAREQSWRVGFAAFGPSVEDGGGDVGVVEALLVEPRWGRRGHGSRLLAATVDIMRRDGLRTAQVWVPEQDAASLAFFISAGWERDGYARSLESEGAPVTEVRLHVSLEEE